MKPLLLCGSGNPALGAAVAAGLGWENAECHRDRFPDGELHVELRTDVRGRDVYVVQSLPPPAERFLFEMLLLADAARRAGAQRLTAVIPYLAYARQDRRRLGREPLGARVVADAIESVGFQRVLAVDLHSEAVEGTFRVPLEHVSAVGTLVAHLQRPGFGGSGAIVVSPDMGGVQRAETFARQLQLPVAIVHKNRLTGSEVRVRGLVGDVRGRAPILVDDVVSTGGTLAAAVDALLEHGCAPEITIAVTHGLFVDPAAARLTRPEIRRVVSTDSVPIAPGRAAHFEAVTVAGLLAEGLRRLQSLDI